MHRCGAFDVARFDKQGNAKVFTSWNEQQGSAPRLFYCFISPLGLEGKKECIMIPILCPDCNREMKVRKVLDTHTALTMCPYCKKEFKISNEKQLFPSNINSFNWGAFTLFPIWCFWNGMPWLFFIYIVGFIPVVGVIITILVSFYLGFKGNKLSWEKKNWSSIQNFEFYQKQWGRAGLTVLVISIFAFIFSMIDIISRAHGYEF